MCLVLISSTQNNYVILSPEEGNYLCEMKKLFHMHDSSQNNVQSTLFLKELCMQLCTLYLNCAYCIPNDVPIDENPYRSFNGGLFGDFHLLLHQHWYTTMCESVCGSWLRCCLIAEGPHLLIGLFCSRLVSLCMITSLSLSLLKNGLWWVWQNSLNETTRPAKFYFVPFLRNILDKSEQVVLQLKDVNEFNPILWNGVKSVVLGLGRDAVSSEKLWLY